jgi:hypothetical protein
LAAITLAGCTSSEEEPAQVTDETNAGSDGTPTPTENPTTADPTTEEGEPEFELISLDVPEEVEIGKEFTISATLKNVGSAPGEFQSAISAKTAESEWQSAGDVETGEIQPDETGEWTSKTVTLPYLMRVKYRIEKLEKEFTIQSISRKLTFGESYTSPSNVVVTTKNVELKSYYEYEGYDGSTEKERAGDGKQWAFVYLKAENKASEKRFIPLSSDINLLAENRQYDEEYINKEDGGYEGSEVEVGIVREGWLAYKIPNNLSKTDLTVAWSGDNYQGEWSVQWSA